MKNQPKHEHLTKSKRRRKPVIKTEVTEKPSVFVNRKGRKFLLELGTCICGAWENASDWGMPGAWDSSEDWCNLHSPLRRESTLSILRSGVNEGVITQAEYEKMRDQK